MDWTQRLNVALDALEDCVDREPDLARIAALANCSPFHFLRMFEVVSGTTPGEYSRRRRLSRAALDLAATNDRVIDIALRYGYETPEAFSKAFKRLFGLTPTEARAPGVNLQTWPPLRLAAVLKGEDPVDYRIVYKPSFEVVGWPLRVSTADGANLKTVPAFWNECLADGRVTTLEEHRGPFGTLGLCAELTMADESFTYFIAVEAFDAPAPPGTRRFSVPSATYAVFPAVGPMPHTVHEAWHRAWSEWFPASDYEHAGTPDFEVYPPFPSYDERGDPASPRCYTEIWIPIQKKFQR